MLNIINNMKPIPSERINEIYNELRNKGVSPEEASRQSIIKYLDEVWDNEYFINLRNRKS